MSLIQKKAQAFIEVARSLSFSDAGRTLGLSVSSVSKYIAEFEHDIGTKLLVRNTRSVNLTPEGQFLNEKILEAVGLLDAAVEATRDSSHHNAGRVHICMPGLLGDSFISTRLPSFMKENPSIDLEISLDDAPDDSLDQPYDIVVRYGPPHDSRRILSRLGHIPTVLVASPSYLAEAGAPLTPEQLVNHSCIGIQLEDEVFDWVLEGRDTLRNLPTFRYHPRSRITIAKQYDRSLLAAVAGLGITVTDVARAMPYLVSGALHTVLPDYRMSYSDHHSQLFMVLHHRDYVPHRVRKVADTLRHYVRMLTAPNYDLYRYQMAVD